MKFTPGVNVYIAANNYTEKHQWRDDFTAVTPSMPNVPNLTLKVLLRTPVVGKKLHSLVVNRLRSRYIREDLAPYCQHTGIDLIHAHFANVGYDFLDLKKVTGLPYVVSFYGMDYEYIPFKRPEFIKYYQKLFKEVDCFICEGEHGKKILTNTYGVSPNKIRIVHLGVESEKIQFYRRKRNAGQLNLIQIASFVEKKGHKYTVSAVAEALKTCPDIRLTLVGSGKLKETVQNQVVDLGISENVEFIEFIDYAKLHSYLQNFDVFIHPSCYAVDRDCEGGAPVVLLDAQATGMPIISTNHCDIPSEVIHEKTGLLSDEGDVRSLAESVIRFCRMSENEYASFADSARFHVHQKFSIHSNAAELANIYSQLV